MKLLTIKILKMKTITFKFEKDSEQEETSKDMIEDINEGQLIASYDNSDPDNLVVIIKDSEDSGD